jgi:hypothetical protein
MSDVVTLQEFAGCLYEAPTAEGVERYWRVDSTTGATFPFDLTTSKISNMKLEGVPIKIEHELEGLFQGRRGWAGTRVHNRLLVGVHGREVRAARYDRRADGVPADWGWVDRFVFARASIRRRDWSTNP